MTITLKDIALSNLKGPTGPTGPLGVTGPTGFGGGGGASVTTSDTPPESPTDGDLWWDTTDGTLKIYYDDGNTVQWVDAFSTAVGPTGPSVTGPTGAASTVTGPTGPGVTGPTGPAGTGGGSGGVTWTLKTTTYTASVGDAIFADTTNSGFTITLPANPSLGDTVQFADSEGTWATNNLTIARNGNTIMELAENLVCDENDLSFSLVYNGATWRIV